MAAWRLATTASKSHVTNGGGVARKHSLTIDNKFKLERFKTSQGHGSACGNIKLKPADKQKHKASELMQRHGIANGVEDLGRVESVGVTANGFD